MPICKQDGFDNASSKNKKEMFHDNEEVFFCEVTKEIFKDYEDYFRHVMAINSTVWQCEATGKDGLTYAEALKSEKRARKKMEMFKDCLRPAVMLVIEHAKQSSLNVLNALTFRFLRKRFFLNEEVQMSSKSQNNPHVVTAIHAKDNKVPADGVYEDTANLMYKLKSLGKSSSQVTVPFDKVRRQRFEFTAENLQMFIKSNVVRVDGILRPKPESYKKYVTERKINFQTIFIGKMPHFTPAKIKKADETKKQATLNNYFGKKDGEKAAPAKLNSEEKAKQLKDKANKLEAKAKSLKEEMERIKREKEEKMAEQLRQKAEKKEKFLLKIEEECSALLLKTDDLERSDQHRMPTYEPIRTVLPCRLIGDAFMLREFMHTFEGLLSGIEVFKGNISFYELARSFLVREVAGPLSDIVLILLGTIFDLQREEEEECYIEYKSSTQPTAYHTHLYAKRHFSFKINELPLDALTISEVLRLHLLSSGALIKNKPAEKWRITYRNGYMASEDPGLSLLSQHPHIVRALKMYTIYQLPFLDVMRVLKCLTAQILTYSATVNLIEERMEQMASARQELRNLVTSENKRLAKAQQDKRLLTNEFNQQCMEDEVKNDPEKRRSLEEKLNKKVAEILAHSEREHKKYEQQVVKLNSSLFNFLVYLGMDRAYRKYYVLESMPGIFIEHSQDFIDTCLENPPKNSLTCITTTRVNLPKTRKELRAYLIKMYTEEAKKTASTEVKKTESGQEDKENQNQQNGSVHSLINGHVNGDIKMDVDEESAPQPTQYQLFMCTGNSRDCIVHDERNTDRQRWSYLHKKEDLDALIESLNPLGYRESELKEQLSSLRDLIADHIKQCPVALLNVQDNQMQNFTSTMMTETQRKYSNSNFGFPLEEADLNEVMYGSLVERILQFESEIYTGDLGRLKVKDMEKWRTDLHNSLYDPQSKLTWGPPKQIGPTNGADEEKMDEDDDNDGSENDADNECEERSYAGKPFRDPGESLGETLEIDSEDSADEGISLHDSETLRSYVNKLASALLQVEQAVGRRFLKEPFGVPVSTKEKDKDSLDRKQKRAINNLLQWEVSLMESTSYSQVYLHLNTLHDCIMWARSTNKSNCMVCRRGSDPDKMLLCDECNGGTHMFCMKPKMKTVPEGNWYCNRCVARLGLENTNDKKIKKNQRNKRKFIVDEDNSDGASEISETLPVKGRSNGAGSGRGRNKRLQSTEIVDLLEDDEDADQDEEVDGEIIAENGIDEDEARNEVDDEADEDEVNDKDEEEVQSNNQSEVDEDESICNICSYDGSELSCTQCKDTFHLECINLKRMPRYNFVCSKCKSKDSNRKRKSKTNSTSSEDDSSEDDEPIVKRSKNGRSSLRNSLASSKPELETAKSSSNGRRSIRRTGDNLPLNSSILYELLEKIMKHENAWPFLRPVLQSEVPDYYDIIKNPMDFAKIKSKLNMGSYQINEEVMRDIELVFGNCDEYNVKGNEIYDTGSALEKFVIDLCKEFNLPFKPSDMNSEA